MHPRVCWGRSVLTIQVVTDKGRVFSLLLLLHGQIHEAFAERGQGIGELYRGHKFQEIRPQNLPGERERGTRPACWCRAAGQSPTAGWRPCTRGRDREGEEGEDAGSKAFC